jgi:hypothetical protein
MRPAIACLSGTVRFLHELTIPDVYPFMTLMRAWSSDLLMKFQKKMVSNRLMRLR